MRELYSLGPSDGRVRDILRGTPHILNSSDPCSPVALGGPSIGYAPNVAGFLDLVASSHSHTRASVHQNDDDVTVRLRSLRHIASNFPIMTSSLETTG